ncbi:HAD family phosphatase [bacterium]|nr:HAD family phosphatase [bacterium]MBU1880906.1 HAD family phosphatase [bacterium]
MINITGIKGVLFDLDGVLIDSMPHHVAAWQKIFEDFGIHVDSLIFRLSEGEKAGFTIRRLAKEYGLEWSDEEFDSLIAKKRAIYRSNAPRGMRPDAQRAVTFCRTKGLKTAIVTGSVKSNLNWTLSDSERGLFDYILSSEDYKNSKPHPEPYQNAARKLRLDPDECLVVENAPLGIRSAKNAGMICIALTSTLPADILDEADLVVPSLDELPDLWNI